VEKELNKMNYIITKQGRWGKISPIPIGKLQNMLKAKMSYKKQGIEFMPNPIWGIVKLYKADKGLFPWGFRNLVKSIFEEWEKYSGETHTIIQDINISFLEHYYDNELRDYQKQAIEELNTNQGGIISMPCRSGKTRVACEYIKQINKPTMVVVTTIDLKEQWEAQVSSDVIVRTYQGLKAKDKNLLNSLGLVIFDECHHVSAKSLYNVAMNCPNAQLVGLSATPYREDGEEMKIEAALGKIVYKISRKELVTAGYLSDAIVKVHNIEPDKYKYWENYQEAYKGYIVNNQDRNYAIAAAALNDYNSGKKVIILCSQIEHMEKLRDLLFITEPLFINGQIKKTERKEIKEKILKADKGLIIIASTVYDEGIDLPEINSVILAAGGKSSIKLIQRSSRVLTKKIIPEKSIIHDFTDSCEWLTAHYKRRRKILEEDFEVLDV
jgi:superfamily II DNA or RNA helicase